MADAEAAVFQAYFDDRPGCVAFGAQSGRPHRLRAGGGHGILVGYHMISMISYVLNKGCTFNYSLLFVVI